MRHYRKLYAKKGWTAERRALQARRIREYKPWLRSTGPKTIEGKRKVSMNAYKHGYYGPENRAIKRYLAASRLLIRTLDRKLEEREEARKAALRAAKQKVVHIIGDCHPAFSLLRRSSHFGYEGWIAGSPSMDNMQQGARHDKPGDWVRTSTIELSEQFRMVTVAHIN